MKAECKVNKIKTKCEEYIHDYLFS